MNCFSRPAASVTELRNKSATGSFRITGISNFDSNNGGKGGRWDIPPNEGRCQPSVRLFTRLEKSGTTERTLVLDANIPSAIAAQGLKSQTTVA